MSLRRTRSVCLVLMLTMTAYAKVTAENIASVTTIAINVLEIKATIRKARAAARATKTVTVKIAKKIAGK